MLWCTTKIRSTEAVALGFGQFNLILILIPPSTLSNFVLFSFVCFSPLSGQNKNYDVLEAAGGGFRRDMEQATDDNQGGGDARLRGEGHVERPLLVSCAETLISSCLAATSDAVVAVTSAPD